jgi:hypothetical protein
LAEKFFGDEMEDIAEHAKAAMEKRIKLTAPDSRSSE